MLVCVIPILAGGAWVASPTLRATIASFSDDYRLYKERNEATSMGMRMEFWQKSLQFFVEAPVIGHGTGSTRGLFEQAATGPQILAAGQVIGNPHNQTLNVAIQWGAGRNRLTVLDVVVSSVAVSGRRLGDLDRIAGGRAKHLHVIVQLTSLRFPRRMYVLA